MGWPSLRFWTSNFYLIVLRSQGSSCNFSVIFGHLHNSGKIHKLRQRFQIPAPTSSSSPTSRICFSVVRCPFELIPVPMVRFWSPETHIKNPEQTDYVWLVNWIFLPDRTILPDFSRLLHVLDVHQFSPLLWSVFVDRFLQRICSKHPKEQIWSFWGGLELWIIVGKF